MIRPGPDEARWELGFVMASGHGEGVLMWALMASVDAGERDWMNDVAGYNGNS